MGILILQATEKKIWKKYCHFASILELSQGNKNWK